MNILFIHEVDWLNKVVFDIHSLAESLSLLGHQVYAIDYEAAWSRSSFFDLGSLKTREFSGVSRAFSGASVCLRRPGFIKIPGLSRLSAGFTQYLEIQKTIKDKSIDVIVLYGVATNGLQTTCLARKFNIPVVFRSIDILNQLVPYPALRPVTRFLEKRVYSKVDMILTLTPKLSDYVIEKGAERARVKLLPMPVDTGLFHPSTDFGEVRQQWGLNEKDRVILFIGTLFDFSGLDVLIPRFAEVIQQIPPTKLLIVGDGPQRPKLEGIIADGGLQEQVIITGFQPYQTMPRYINLAALCINTFLITEATRDIFPGKIVQYLACGKAVIATALPGMLAVIPGEEQGVVYTNNVDEMVREMVALLKSTERRQQLEGNGLNYVTRVHSHDKIAH
ncbi:MAG: glycosyltransferase, partial [bacterium]|nr:glycosyltransferase [bacterium]